MKGQHEAIDQDHQDQGRDAGSALIVAIAVLFVMVLLAVALANISGVGRQSSSQFTDQVRVRMLAQSGIESVLSADMMESKYYGEDWNADGEMSGALPSSFSGTEDRNGNDNGKLERFVDPKYALHPSLARTDRSTGNPELVPVRRSESMELGRGYSGRLPSSYGGGSDTYSLKVIDNSTKLNVNSLNPRMGLIIDAFFQKHENGGNTSPGSRLIGTPSDVSISTNDTDGDGDPDERIYTTSAARPDLTLDLKTMSISGGFSDISEVKSELSGSEFELLKRFLVVHSNTWVDRTVINPKPQNSDRTDPSKAGELPDETPGRPKAIWRSRENRHTERVDWVAPDGSTVKQDYGPFHYDFDYTLEPRAPVNINRIPEEMVAVLIEDIRARIFEVTNEGGNQRAMNPNYQTRVIEINNPDTADSIAEEIVRYRKEDDSISFRGSDAYTGPFQTWPEFEAFVDQELVANSDGSFNGDINVDQGYLLKAHFNPNVHFGKFNWNTNGQWTWISTTGNRAFIDKTDFIQYSTEFTFYSGGMFEVSSYGRITGPNHYVKAESSIKAVVNLYNIARHTTQADFLINEESGGEDYAHPPVEGTPYRTYPESVVNVGLDRIRNRTSNGSGLAGQLSLGTNEDFSPPPGTTTYVQMDWGNNRSKPLMGTRGKPDNAENDVPFQVTSENNPHLPYSFYSREFDDVADDATEDPHGALTGSYDDRETSNYPWSNSVSITDPTDTSEDPYNYSDVVSDGVLLTHDRYRNIRFLTTEDVIDSGGSRTENWANGHVEFWWKPRAGTLSRKLDGQDPPLDRGKIVFPLFQTWLLGGPQKLFNPISFNWAVQQSNRVRKVDELSYFTASCDESAENQSDVYGPVESTRSAGNVRWRETGHIDFAPVSGNGTTGDSWESFRGVDTGNQMSDWTDPSATYTSNYSDGQGSGAIVNPANGAHRSYPGVAYHMDDTPRTFPTYDSRVGTSAWMFGGSTDSSRFWANARDFGASNGYFIRAFYVKDPDGEPYDSYYIFKISRESYLDVDDGLQAPRSPDRSTEARTDVQLQDRPTADHFFTSCEGEDCFLWADVYAILPVNSSTKKAEPKPGKWNHIVLEWKNISSRKRVLVDEYGADYPIYVPSDFTHDHDPPFSDAENLEASGDNWNEIFSVYDEPGNDEEQLPTQNGHGSNQGGDVIVPYIMVNGEQHTRTEIYANNISPRDGRFHPAASLHSIHGCLPPESQSAEDVEWTPYKYARIWSRKYFGNIGMIGSNFHRRTHRYGKWGNTRPFGDRAAEDPQFYADHFAEGTIDNFLWTSLSVNKMRPEPPTAFYESRYHTSNEDTRFVGRFRRQSDAFWNTNGNERPDRFNDYASLDQRVLTGTSADQVRVIKVAHTQYRPKDDFTGVDYKLTDSESGEYHTDDDLSDTERPYFRITFGTGSSDWKTLSYSSSSAPENRWLGEPVAPNDLFDSGSLTVKPGEHLTYRIEGRNEQTPQNVTPFLEDLTVMYRSGGTRIKEMFYYVP